MFSEKDLKSVETRDDLIRIAKEKNVNIKKAIRNLKYEIELEKLQTQLVDFQQWVNKNKLRVAILFEGKDAAGKGGAIRRISSHIYPRHYRIVTLPMLTEDEDGQWYFQRYVNKFPKPGEIVFFDRSWYNP